jgi:large subunit ribosomal protein L4
VVTLKKYNLKGEAIGEIAVADWLKDAEANSQMVKDYITAVRANARQWNAHTKTRSEVVHTTKKPHPQKGQGRARQGSLVSPQYRGGGRVFGPRHKVDQHIRINKKEKRAIIRFLVAEKLRQEKLYVIDSTEMKEPQTKAITNLLKSFNITRRALFVGEGTWGEIEIGDISHRFSEASDHHANFIKSLRNIPTMDFSLATNVNGYDLLVAHHMVVSEQALKELEEWLS